MNINELILWIIAALFLVGMIFYFPKITQVFINNPFMNKDFSSLTFAQQSKVSTTFNEFTANIEKCLGNGKAGCICNNTIPNYPFVFETNMQKSIAIEIIPSKDLSKFVMNLTFNGKSSNFAKEISGEIYVVDKSGKEIIDPKFKLEKRTLTFRSTPILAAGKNFDIKSSAVYKPTKTTVDFLTGTPNFPLC